MFINFKSLYELELHVQRILGKEVRFEDIKENGKKLRPTLCKAETTKGRERMV